jgi:hypothetical protein
MENKVVKQKRKGYTSKKKKSSEDVPPVKGQKRKPRKIPVLSNEMVKKAKDTNILDVIKILKINMEAITKVMENIFQ